MNNFDKENLSYEYIRGFTEGEGCFSFATTSRRYSNGEVVKIHVPSFTIGLHERDEDLLNKIRDKLGLKNKIYNYSNNLKDGYKRGRKAVLVVREFGQLKNIIVPLFYGKLRGYKGQQFIEWLEKIGNDPSVPQTYKLLYRLHVSGYYSNNPKFID